MANVMPDYIYFYIVCIGYSDCSTSVALNTLNRFVFFQANLLGN